MSSRLEWFPLSAQQITATSTNKIPGGEYKNGSGGTPQSSAAVKSPIKYLRPIVFSILATFFQLFIFWIISDRSSLVQNDPIAVMVATKNLIRGDAVTSDNFKAVLVKPSEILAAVVKQSDFEAFKGRKLAVAVGIHNALPKIALFSDLQQRSMPELIPPGKRLFKLQASLGALANVLKPGDRVDVIAVMELPQVGRITETLLEAQDVIGIGDNLLDDKTEGNRGDDLSFFVTLEQFKLLTYASNFAQFSIALRNPNDISQSDGATSMTLNKFLANPRIQNALKSDYFKIRKGSDNAR